ncbi:unnamed protein product [Cladocopium goreaui]|uniref:Uncharacterized protein n=1 Tax=Cladocopium goreaui TaxID=2562237 RepID=A0A9P1CC28_9DINO|nr:unnamed protein product [Cladocopium goreaui]
MTLSRSVSSGPTTSTSARTASRVVSAPAARTVVSASRVVQSPASSPRVVQRGLAKVITERPRSAAPRTRLVARNDGATNGATTGAVDSVSRSSGMGWVEGNKVVPQLLGRSWNPCWDYLRLSRDFNYENIVKYRDLSGYNPLCNWLATGIITYI